MKPPASNSSSNAREPGRERTCWDRARALLTSALVRTVFFWGKPGIGKTHAAIYVGSASAIFIVTLTEDTPASELRGNYLPVAGELVWHDGPFTAAMRQGARLVINEVTHANADVLSLLMPVLESEKTARLTLPSNETVSPAPGFFVVCTDNLPPDDLPEALRDRFDCVLHIDRPNPEALALLSPALRQTAERLFALEPDRFVSLRGWLAIERLQHTFGLEEACLLTLGLERGALIYDAIKLSTSD